MDYFYTKVDRYKNTLYVRGYDRITGKQISFKTDGVGDLNLNLYLECTKEQSNTNKKGLLNENLFEINFNEIKGYNQYLFQEQKNRRIYNSFLLENQYITQNQLYKDYKKDFIRIGFIDVETTSINGFPLVRNPEEELIVFSCYSTHTKVITVFVSDVNKNVYLDKILKEIPDSVNVEVNIKIVNNEIELLESIISYFKKEKFDILSGWFISIFDLPYIYYRIVKILGEDKANSISPFKKVRLYEEELYGEDLPVVEFFGMSILDYMFLYKKFVLQKHINYKLDTISEDVLGDKKLDYSEYNTIQEFWEKNPAKFVAYNIVDTFLVNRLEDKKKVIQLVLSFSYIAKQNYGDAFSPVKTWESLCYNHLYEQEKVVPPMKLGKKDEAFKGAFVKLPIIGFHKSVVSFDVTSLYPSIAMLLNISPETHITRKFSQYQDKNHLEECLYSDEFFDHLPTKTYPITFSINGQFYDKRQQGMIPFLMKSLFDRRSETKKQMIVFKNELEEIKQQIKILEKGEENVSTTN